jgi:FKBP-type peptidyl-prolyl cis-trans isomerase FklB
MKINLLVMVCIAFAIVSCSNNSGNTMAGSGSKDLAGEIDSVSYSLGSDMASSIKGANINEINLEAFIDGFVTTMNNDTANQKIKTKDLRPLVMGYIKKLQDKKNLKNKADGEAFLAANKNKPGVKLTKSGVQYIVIKEGNGPIPVDTNIVKVNFEGKLINDTIFQSTYQMGQPIELMINNTIKGWQEVLTMMPVGSKWKIFIPQELGYGPNVRPGGKIEPYMALIFEMELLEIMPPKPQVKPSDMNNQVKINIPKKETK